MNAPGSRRALAVLLAVAAALSASTAAGGDAPGPGPGAAPRTGARGEDLTITVLTFGPGDHPFYKFGHDAIWIHDAPRGEDGVYNYGMFSFDEPGVVLEFFGGRFRYWLAREGIETLDEYRDEHRTILAQELDLPPADRLALSSALDENALPENRASKYDYYRDNCATRVRDLVDRATHGRLHGASAGPGRLSYRGHTLRMTWDAPFENLLLDWIMGPNVDRPISRYDELFLPGELAEALRRTRLVGHDGVEHPLVRSEILLNDPPHRDPPEVAPSWIGRLGAVGVALGAALALLGRRASGSRAARIALGSLLATVGLFFGFFGTSFVGIWAFIDHEVGYRNENVLLAPPWALALLVAGVALARGARWAPRLAAIVVTASALSAAVASIGKALPWMSQHNARFVVFALPIWIGAAIGLRLRRRA